MINQRYILKKKLGVGRSQVFLCTDVEYPGNDIAIKILSPDSDIEEHNIFRNEFFTLKKLSHPGIIKALDFSMVLDCEESDLDFDVKLGSNFFTLEYFPGETIGEVDFENNRKLLEEVIKQICSALFYLHLSDYIYFDLKIENILFLLDGANPKIKLIDMGFAAKLSEVAAGECKGSTEYIAPELLQNKKYDHRVDLYSLGTLLFKLVFKKFPFTCSSELEIYKEHIERIFSIETIEYFPELQKVISRLFEKDPEKRYSISLQILKDLNIEIDPPMIRDFHPAAVFAGRKDIINIVRNFIRNKELSEIYSLHGFDGAGKSAVVDELEFLFENIVVLKAGNAKSGEEFLKFIVRKILYCPKVYTSINETNKIQLRDFLNSDKKLTTSELRIVLASVVKEAGLVLVIDDYNQFDAFILEFMQELFPLLQVNGAKIILTDNFGSDSNVNKLHNVIEIDLSSFTSVQLHDFIDRSFFHLFPKSELEKVILRYADLLPGSIIDFIGDLILLEVLKFSEDGITIQTDEAADKILTGSQDDIYKIRFASLKEEDKNCARILSSFEVNLDLTLLQSFTEQPVEEIKKILAALFYQNIIQNYQVTNYISFTSQGIKNFIYESIEQRKFFHLEIGTRLRERLPRFNRIETARHFEIAGDTLSVFSLYKEEIKNAEKISAFSYQVKLLNKLTEVPLTEEDQFYVYSLLAEKNYLLLNYSAALDAIEKIEDSITDKTKYNNIWLMKAKALIETNKAVDGKSLLLSLMDTVKDDDSQKEFEIELANCEFELHNYKISLDMFQKIIVHPYTNDEDKGKSHNLIAFIYLQSENNLAEALKNFLYSLEFYRRIKSTNRVANILNNIGNLYNILGNSQEAESAWEEALVLNSSVGSLVQEAKQIMNYGVYYHDRFEHHLALEKFERAKKIFLSLGDNIGASLARLNLSELYIDLNEFNVTDKWLNEIINTFKEASMEEEVCETLFLNGYLNYLLGNVNGLSRKILEYNNFIKDKDFSNRIRNHFKFLKALESFIENENDVIAAFSEVAYWYLENGDKKNYLRAWNFSIENLIASNQYESALSLLNDQKYLSESENNILFKAEKEYFLGRITKNLNINNLAVAANYFESALGLLNDEKILEVTWKVLLELAIYYNERGQISKAANYSKYAYSSIKFLTENINNQQLKKFYLEKKSVKVAFEITKSIIQNGGQKSKD